ncbi:prepilin-type N-terminal cleavage/methylation domain-containing protein, partial [Candidatus Kaiserbacteria bacterium]|nr:prepilin-type N-terminal cleavage/methylation domain-containing protein [Candidatus Kaiserbacteria bacterium]
MKNFSKQHGFSLVEVLVAITLLLLIVTGPMKIITDANHSTAFASEQVTAFFLAQEGLELAQKGRDDLMLQYFDKQFNNNGNMVNPWAKF